MLNVTLPMLLGQHHFLTSSLVLPHTSTFPLPLCTDCCDIYCILTSTHYILLMFTPAHRRLHISRLAATTGIPLMQANILDMSYIYIFISQPMSLSTQSQG